MSRILGCSSSLPSKNQADQAVWPFRRRRRPGLDVELLQKVVAHWHRMDDDHRARITDGAFTLASDITWEAARGMSLDDEVITTIAGRASLLVSGRSTDQLRVRTVVVHQSTVVLESETSGPVQGTRSEGRRHLHGQADDSGLVLLAWDAVSRGGRDGRYGYDVVLHEFAHSLDAGDGMFDGTPAVGGSLRDRWIELASNRFDELRAGDDPGVLRPYGATNTAEFFAVAVEALFGRPHQLRAADPDFYAVLADLMGLDPCSWVPAPSV